MPLVFTQRLSASDYSDKIGEHYEIPNYLLKSMGIKEGEEFVYYCPTDGETGKFFFGTGRIKRLSGGVGKSTALIENYREFARKVPYKDEKGNFNETGDAVAPFFRVSVRRIEEENYKRIISLGK